MDDKKILYEKLSDLLRQFYNCKAKDAYEATSIMEKVDTLLLPIKSDLRVKEVINFTDSAKKEIKYFIPMQKFTKTHEIAFKSKIQSARDRLDGFLKGSYF